MVKMNFNDKDLVLNFPGMFHDGLVAIMKRVGAKASDSYDWEVPEGVKYIEEQRKIGSYAWENAAEFFKSDPIKVDSSPPPASKRRGLGKLTKLVSLDAKKQQSQQSRVSSAGPNVHKGNGPFEQTLYEMQEKLSLFYGVEEQAQPELKDIVQQFLGKDLKSSGSLSLCKEEVNEIRQQQKKLTSGEGVKEIKQKTGSIIKQKDREKNEKIVKTQHERIGSKEPAEKKVSGKETTRTDDVNMKKDEKVKIEHNERIGSKDSLLEKKLTVMKPETEPIASKKSLMEKKALTTKKPGAADDVKEKKDERTKIKHSAERIASKEPIEEKKPLTTRKPEAADDVKKKKDEKTKIKLIAERTRSQEPILEKKPTSTNPQNQPMPVIKEKA